VLESVPAIIRVLVVFVVILIAIRRRFSLGNAFISGAVLLGLLFGMNPKGIALSTLSSLVEAKTMSLSGVVCLILVLSHSLEAAGQMARLLARFQGLIHRPRINLVVFPALIGLLPMPGGAIFSAPMVKTLGKRLRLSGDQLSYINYWFRHVWEYVFPLYPSMMLAAALLEMTTLQLAYATWPLAITAVVGGAVFGLWGIGSDAGEKIEGPTVQHPVRSLVDSIWPIVLVLGLSLVLPLDERLRLIVSLLVTIALLMVVKRVPASELGTILRERIPWKTVAVIFGALIFRRVLDESSAVVAVSRDLTALKVPPALIAFSVPFIAGLLTGLASAAFSIGFPVVAPLLIDGAGSMTSAWAAWLMAGGFLGVMLSPLHLCLSLTRVYFRAEWGPIYRRMAPAVLSVALVAGLLLLVRV